MWILVMFDLPTEDNEDKRNYIRFVKSLKKDGFYMLQYSVYARPCPTEENSRVHFQRVKRALPPEGEVRIIELTDKQFSRMEIFVGKSKKPTEKQPEQLSFL